MRARLAVLALLALTAGSLRAQTAPPSTAGVRLKDLVVVEGAAPVQLVGYGLVVGLDRTGDRARAGSGAVYTVQSIANMLRAFGVAVDPQQLAGQNAAAVMVTATLAPYAAPGTALDVTVSALGDARSLAGGVLLQTPLLAPATNTVHATAQGPVSTGTLLAAAAGASTRTGPTNTGRVPGGGLVTAGSGAGALAEGGSVGLALRAPDFTNANAVAEAVRGAGAEATVVHAGLVRVVTASAEAPALMARLEGLRVAVSIPARVVINERTGSVVAGGDVRIAQVMVTHGGIVVATRQDPVVSQPNPLGRGETVTRNVGTANVAERPARSVVLGPSADVAALAAALNDLGLAARDVIAIFQAIDRAGALQGELVIL